MINNSPRRTPTYLLPLACLVLAPLLFSSGALAGSKKYRQNTVVDFEGSVVEGKSRKPYSSYLSQEKNKGFGSLSNWQPDVRKKMSLQADKANSQL